MTHPRIRRALHLIAAPAIVALVIAFYFRVVSVNNTTVALTLLLVIFGISAWWGLLEATIASLAAVLGFNYYFLPPIGSFEVRRPPELGSAHRIPGHLRDGQPTLGPGQAPHPQEAVERRREVEGLYALSQSLLLSGSARTASQDLVSRVVRILGVTTAAFHAKLTHETFRWGPDDPLISDEQLQVDRDEALIDRGRGLALVPVRLGGQALGNLGLTGALPSDAVLNAVAYLVAIGIERARTLEEASRAEAARQSEVLKSALLDALAHDFKTPLTSIKAAVTSLLGQPRPDAERELMTIINEEADRLNRLVAEVLEMVRIEAGKLHLEKRAQDVSEIIGATLAELKSVLHDRPWTSGCRTRCPRRTPISISCSRF
jgi:two-component system, OmpR family, sensor histidine kinase KdpD